MNRPSTLRREFLIRSGALSASVAAGGPLLCAGQDGGPPLIVHSQTPMNAEPPLGKLAESWVTPNELFYIRSHAPVPQVDVGQFRLRVEGLVRRPLELSLADLRRRFGAHSVFATLTCAGNRRSEHSQVKEVGGVQWREGAIGNALWTGPRLSDVLRKAGLMAGARHVWFEGVDQVDRDGQVIPFGASIPLAKAMEDSAAAPGVLLAYEMNDKPLPPDHGYPLRTVVPGYIGARSVKWLGRIVVSDRPSDNHYVAGAYKLVTESTPQQWQAAEPLQAYAMNSVICRPASGAAAAPGLTEVRGFALPPGEGRKLLRRVELSADEGASWTAARLDTPRQVHCWQLWTAHVRITADTKSLTVRATDTAGETQPKSVPWNLKGYMFNAWHRVELG